MDLRALFLAGREIEYARNQVLLHALQRFADVDVIAGHKGRSLSVNGLDVARRAAPLLLRRRYDLVFIGFYGHLILRLLTPLIRAPLLFDAFVSTYDTLCFDRQLYTPNSPAGRMAFWLDRANCLRADHVLLDTRSHVDYFVETFDLPRDRFDALPVGCSDAIFTLAPLPARNDPLRVLGYSTFLPLHGMDVILDAAAQLTDASLTIKLIGDGPLHAQMRKQAQRLALTNVTFAPPVSPTTLAREIAAADICLGGHFSSGEKAGRVIPGKIYQMLAVGRPVIAADAPGNRELLTHGETAWFVPPGDAGALAQALCVLAGDRDLRHRLARTGRALYERCCSEAVIARRLEAIVDDLLCNL